MRSIRTSTVLLFGVLMTISPSLFARDFLNATLGVLTGVVVHEHHQSVATSALAGLGTYAVLQSLHPQNQPVPQAQYAPPVVVYQQAPAGSDPALDYRNNQAASELHALSMRRHSVAMLLDDPPRVCKPYKDQGLQGPLKACVTDFYDHALAQVFVEKIKRDQ